MLPSTSTAWPMQIGHTSMNRRRKLLCLHGWLIRGIYLRKPVGALLSSPIYTWCIITHSHQQQQQKKKKSHTKAKTMSGSGAGVWVFRNGVMQLEQPAAASRKALVYTPTNEVVRSVEALERRLASLGWERYYENRSIVQLHKRDGGADLITIPRDFASLRSTHMYDVVVKNRDHFKVVDA